MTSALPLKDLLIPTYNPADDSQPRFPLNYDQLVRHRDFLRQKYNAKEQRRQKFKQTGASAAAFQGKGNPFGVLADDDDGSATSASSRHIFAVSLTEAQSSQLTIENRKAEVDKIKKDIEILERKEAKRKEDEGKKKREAVEAEQEESGDGEGATREETQDGAKAQGQDEASESEPGQRWETPKRRNKR